MNVCVAAKGATFFVRGFGCALFIFVYFWRRKMAKYKCPEFDRLEEGHIYFQTLPLCEILQTFIGDRDYGYLDVAMYPIEICEVILHFLEHTKGVDKELLRSFSEKYITVDSLYPIDKLIELWGREKYDNMIADIKKLAE